MDIKQVLVADAVDPACVELLQKNGIKVDCKYKLSKEDLIKELQVRDFFLIGSGPSSRVVKDPFDLHYNLVCWLISLHRQVTDCGPEFALFKKIVDLHSFLYCV